MPLDHLINVSYVQNLTTCKQKYKNGFLSFFGLSKLLTGRENGSQISMTEQDFGSQNHLTAMNLALKITYRTSSSGISLPLKIVQAGEKMNSLCLNFALMV